MNFATDKAVSLPLMASEGTRGGDSNALDSSAAEVERERLRWRESVLRVFLWTTVVTVVMTSAFTAKDRLMGWATEPFLVVTTALVVTAMANRLAFRTRVAVLLVSVYLACALNLATTGVAPNVMVGLCLLVVMAVVLLGRGWGVAGIALAVVSVVGTGWLTARGIIPRASDWYVMMDSTNPLALARMELRIFLEEWLKRMPDISIEPEFLPSTRGGAIMALRALPLVW